ncbi:unnamed protein product, partial [Dicrocoelium dendriticum]
MRNVLAFVQHLVVDRRLFHTTRYLTRKKLERLALLVLGTISLQVLLRIFRVKLCKNFSAHLLECVIWFMRLYAGIRLFQSSQLERLELKRLTTLLI